MTIIASDFSWDLNTAALAAVSSAAFPVLKGTFHPKHLPEEDQYKPGSDGEQNDKSCQEKDP